METKILDGKEVAGFINKRTLRNIEFLKERNIHPGLAVVLVGNDPASSIYVRSKGRACEKLGIFSITQNLPESTSQQELLELVEQLNSDPKYNGILVQLPLPRQIEEFKIIETVRFEKDVDCFHPHNVGLLTIGKPYLWPCTPAGIIEIFKYYDIETSGKNVVVMGRSNIVGKTIANILLQKAPNANATVTVVHSRTQNISDYISRADIIIAAMGQAEFVKKEMIKEGAIIVDVGMNRVDDPTSEKGYRLTGDVDFKEVLSVASAITPVPGGVGPMTIAMLMHNTVAAAAKQNNISLEV